MPRHEPVPSIPIAAVLEALGAVDVPYLSSGHKKIRCPFHGPDRNPSASVGRYSFRCFTCDRKGDAISLIREEEGVDFATALERAKAIVGYTSSEVQRGGWGSDLLSDE